MFQRKSNVSIIVKKKVIYFFLNDFFFCKMILRSCLNLAVKSIDKLTLQGINANIANIMIVLVFLQFENYL